MDADMAAAAASEANNPHHSPTPPTPASDDDDESRSWIFKQLPGPWWWCEDCQALVSSPEITIAHLFAVLRQWTPYAQLQLITIVDEILRRGAHVDDRDGLTDMTLLHFSAKSGALGDEESACRIAEFLLDNGANLEARCRWTDMTALHYAAYFDCPMLVELLIRRGAQLEARSRMADGATPLHLAATQLSLGATRVLLHASTINLVQAESDFAGKESLDGLGRTPYQCLPPKNQLAEPLCSLRDRLSELLGPAVRLPVNGLEQDPLNERTDSLPTPRLSRATTTNGFPAHSVQCNGHDSQPNPPADGMSWLVAESGYLSPRVPRVQPTPPKAPVISAEAPPAPIKSRTPLPVVQQPPSPATLPRPSTAPNKLVALNHPLPATSSISAKVTLQSLGLALDDRVCIGPGNTGNSAKMTPSRSHARDPGPIAMNSRIGHLRYCGPVAFAAGVWVGVELDEPLGRNNGTVAGVQYFSCAANYGVFAPIGRVYKAVCCDGANSQQWLPVRQSVSSRMRPGTPRQPTPQSPDHEGDASDGSRGPIRVSRSSYSLTGSLSSNENEHGSQHSGGTGSSGIVVSHPPIDVSHVTAKIDTGLRVRSPDMNASAKQLALGDRVLVAGQRKGVIRFIGQTQFAPGIWYGVELDQAVGKNNGSVAGVRYFQCAVGHGIFAPLSRLHRLPPTCVRSATSTPQCSRAVTAGLRHASMTGSMYGPTAGSSRSTRPTHRQAWSTTTSPMVGRAVVGRPALPQELINALHAAGHTPKEIKDPPVFYLTEGMQVLCAGEIERKSWASIMWKDTGRSDSVTHPQVSSSSYPVRLIPAYSGSELGLEIALQSE
ncbi:CAP-Gly domain-containing linker protein 3 [Fasciola hepatica]|uniref:CAP-Gly domain-containing linker protein 3 n=1 Tax=Fasciola hepatica TaxID=6192 RepID=A0A4E0RK58_FASHE|nr:CAP-Gly domain-containing linker protein 3 [Fasciola hepatica]